MDSDVKTVIIVVLLVGSVVFGIMMGTLSSTQYEVDSEGHVRAVGLELYGDANLTEQTSFVDWGMVAPNETVSRSYYVLNPTYVTFNINCYAENYAPA